MVNPFDRPQKIVTALWGRLFWFFLMLGISSWAVAENKVWIGTLQEYKFKKSSERQLSLQVALEEYTQEGKFNNFDESTIVLVDRDPSYLKWTIILDNISPGKWQDVDKPCTQERPWLEKIQIELLPGSFSNPSLTKTQDGIPLNSTKIVLTGNSPFFLTLKEVDKQDISHITLFFEMNDEIPAVPPKQKNGTRIELSVNDFDQQRQVGNLIPAPDTEKRTTKLDCYLRKLNALPRGSFVTLIYKVRYYDVNLLRNQLDLIKSDVGQVGVLEPTAKILLRDRVEYVTEMVRLLFSLDTPVPQVVIDVCIIERNMIEGSDFFATWSYWGKHGDQYGGRVGPEAEAYMNNGNAKFSYLNNDLLRNFQVYVNAEIQKGKSRIRATTRIMCKNREAAQFNSGTSIPYYRMREFSRDDKDTDYISKEKSTTAGRTDNLDASGNPTTSSVTSSNYQRQYDYGVKDDTVSRRWNLEFIQTGVNLWLRPYIKNSSLVELALKPSYSEITGQATAHGVPLLSTRSLDTILTAKDGETIVIGGLFYEKELKLRKGIPLLMDIPLLGPVFSTENTEKQQSEIVFVLTVYVQYPK